MAKRVTPIPIAPCYRILKKAGANRVSHEARKVFVEVITEFAEKVAERAVDLARHANRKTVLPQDIKLAAKSL